MKKVLTIAGSDSSGGAGIQADIKTITVHKMYAMSVITALTAQNTMGVTGIMDVAPEFVEQQLDAVFSDIVPDAVKIGMVSNSAIIRVIARKLDEYKPKAIVIDPVMISTSGFKLITDEARDTLISELLPLGTIVTPNIPEAEVLCGFSITGENDMISAGKAIEASFRGAVLVKGGHLIHDAMDLLYENGHTYWYRSERVNNPNTHGTGCTLSSAIACNLAAGKTLDDSIKCAKDYLTGALKSMLDLGKGSGPLNHTYCI
ncbi:MAG: bifunctional hydroxymethylpyrimidine kinase/phosphomethylpyrimidine kinase [Anaerocolumna sp.]